MNEFVEAGLACLAIVPLFYGHFFDCLFIDSFCDLCPTRHHKRGATRDYSQQNSSIALLLSHCFRGTATKLQGVTVGAGSACPCIPPQYLPLRLWICVLFQVFLS